MADNELREQVRIHLIQCRIEHELTQTEVGKIAGKSKNAVASWEQGLSLPDAVTLYKLARHYNKTMDLSIAIICKTCYNSIVVFLFRIDFHKTKILSLKEPPGMDGSFTLSHIFAD